MIYIIIPVFNRKEYTEACLQALRHQTYRDFRTIVVDDGSTDGTADVIRRNYPAVTVLPGDGTLWWAGATNAGITHALSLSAEPDTDFILTLNNDLIVKEDYLANLVAAYQTNAPCLIGSVSVDIRNPDRVDYMGVRWNRFTARYSQSAQTNTLSYSELQRTHDTLPTDLLPGRGTLIPLAIFRAIGLFDNVRFPQYAADEDFSYRASRAGYPLLLAVKAVVFSHSHETGLHLSAQQPTYRTLWQSMTSIKSPTNMTVRFNWAMKNTELKVVYFIIDSLRILTSFHLRLLRRILPH